MLSRTIGSGVIDTEALGKPSGSGKGKEAHKPRSQYVGTEMLSVTCGGYEYAASRFDSEACICMVV
ncbi:hypothetical protein FAGAP_4742, partial [Fusarium agapanthi]